MVYLVLQVELILDLEYGMNADADIVLITAGKAQKPGQTRLDLLKLMLKLWQIQETSSRI